MNKVIFCGNLTKDPELRYTTTEKQVVILNIAINEKEKTNFFQVEFWNKSIENIMKYCTKGKKVLIEGKVKNSNYEKDGRTIYKNAFVGEKIYFLSSSKKEEEIENVIEEDDDPFSQFAKETELELPFEV